MESEQQQDSKLFSAYVDRFCVAALLLSVEALYAAQGQEDPTSASRNSPIWILGPVETGETVSLLQLPASI